MKHWQQLSIKDRLDVLEISSAKTKLPQLAIEKDWWVTMVLKALSKTRHSNLMSFKGGTSLSKGWNLIKRFSEDIDIAIRREGEFKISSTSNYQLTIAEWKKDYVTMQKHFIYDENSLSFEALIGRMEELTARIRKLN